MVATKPPSDDGQSPRPRLKRDEKLWSLLPTIDAPYDYHSLSRAETDALVEALDDGFGNRLRCEPLPLPSKVNSGLLNHAFYFHSEYDADERDDIFWNWDENDDAPPPYEWFPIEFSSRRLRIYFENQFQRFCKQIAREKKVVHPLIAKQWASKRLYEKPWYEFHALQFLDFIEMSEKPSRYAALGYMLITGFAGQLGRLVEQYYWRFRFERAAVAGESARKGASAGGKVKAEKCRTQHSVWQNEALKIWANRPKLKKHAVAEIIRKQCDEEHTAKHIARYLTHPKIIGREELLTEPDPFAGSAEDLAAKETRRKIELFGWADSVLGLDETELELAVGDAVKRFGMSRRALKRIIAARRSKKS